MASLIGQNQLGQSNADLNQALTRLSTGLRINTGKDDPAGLIASENLRSDITAIRRAIGNTDRATQVIATADSALGQVSSLLNDIRGLVTESANSGALSQEQIDANQLQVDSSLEALNRIAQTTTFQGRRLLDGSLDFLTTAGANSTNISNIQIDQANLGATGQVAVDVNVTSAATQASVAIANLPDVTPTTTTALEIEVETQAATASNGSVSFSIVTQDTTQGNGDFTTTAAGSLVINGETIELTADAGGTGGNLDITALAVTFGNGGSIDATDTGGGALQIDVASAEGTADIQEVIDAINASSIGFSAALATGSTATTTFDETTNGDVTAATLGDLVGGGGIDLTAIEDGTADGTAINGLTNVTVTYGAGAAGATFDGTTLAVSVTQASGTATLANVVAAIDAGGDLDATLASGTGSDAFSAVDVVTADGDGAAEITTTETIDITGTLAAGEDGNIAIGFAEAALGGGSPTTNVIGNATAGYTVQINTDIGAGVSIDDIRTAIASISEVDTAVFNGTPGTSTFNAIDVGGVTPDAAPATVSLANGDDATRTTQTINLTTAIGYTGNFDITLDATTNTSGAVIVTGSEATGYTVNVDSTTATTIEDIRAAIVAQVDEIGAAALGQNTTGSNTFNTANGDTVPATLNVVGAGAGSETTGVDANLVFELAGETGSEVLSFEGGTTVSQLLAGINAVSDATGVTAALDDAATGIEFSSSGYGTDAFVDIQIIDEGNGNTPAGAFTDAVGEGARSTGADVTATVNGITATGDGNNLSINTATLDLSATLTADFVGSTTFTITGGGALFQLGPDVVSNQQARLGINSVNTAALGGNSGLLYQLGTGGTADLTSDPSTAAEIVESAIDQVTSLRGRLGAFQRTTLETNRNALNDTLSNLTEAVSSIRDADFAAESAALTRAQILVQSGTNVLSIANQNPQNVLALLR
ncbi:MAG: flagellin [Planctomycetota bacterium]